MLTKQSADLYINQFSTHIMTLQESILQTKGQRSRLTPRGPAYLTHSPADQRQIGKLRH